jgi:hypothetical protein
MQAHYSDAPPVTTEATRHRAAALNARLHRPGRVPMLDAQGFPIPRDAAR